MNEVRTTFVPRRPTLASPQVAAPRGPDFVALFATLIFLFSAIAAGGVYAWRWNLSRQIDGQAAQLAAARDSFDARFVEQASLLNDRIVAANKILDSHLAPSELLNIFEQFTIRSISFQTFSAIHQTDGSVDITASGVGRKFESVVLQSDWFGDGPAGDGARLRDVVFSRLGENDRREATFNFSATIPVERILFSRSISQIPAALPSQRSTTGTAPAAATSSPAAAPTAPAARTAPAAPATTGTKAPPPGSVTI